MFMMGNRILGIDYEDSVGKALTRRLHALDSPTVEGSSELSVTGYWTDTELISWASRRA